MSDEERLRRALAELAPRATADDRARDGVERAIGRRRRHQVVGRVAAALVLLGLAAGLLAVRRGGDGRHEVENPPASGPAPGTGPSTSDPGTGRITFANVSFALPAGWEVVPGGADPGPGPGREALCIAPAGNPYPRYGTCAGLTLYHGDLPGYRGRPYVKDGSWGFAHGEEPAPCPVGPPDPGAPGPDVVVAGAVGTRPIDTGLRAVGNRKADYDQWFARCSRSNFTFTPRGWYLPTSRIVVLDVLGHPETEGVLASFQFGSESD